VQARIGIVLALPSEARIFSGFRLAGELDGFPFWSEPGASYEKIFFILSGPGPERAGRAARILLDNGVRSLVSTGVSGGLSPDVLPGALILAEQVQGPDSRYTTTPSLTDELHGIISVGGAGIVKGLVLCRNEPVTSSRTKNELYRETGALAVDMESAAVSAEADRVGSKFAVLRAICDPAHMSLPFDPAAMLKPDGDIRYGALLSLLLFRPARLPELYRTGRAFSRAMASLRIAWNSILSRR